MHQRYGEEARRFIDAHFDAYLDDLCVLAAIPAPSHHEERRAAWVKKYLEDAGARGVHIDEALNVVLPFCPEAEHLTMFMAHTDVVFPDTAPLPVVRERDVIRAPGIGDDTAQLMAMLLVTRFILSRGLRPREGVIIAANSCEEGLGNLKGCRRLMDTYGARVREFVTFDGTLDTIVAQAVGSQRYRVTVKTEGGHSYGNFGNRNAIQVLAGLITTLYQMKPPPYGRTTYNVGEISGGTSVNTIAQEASMLYEFRSDDRRGLREMEEFFESALACIRAMGVTVECELLGLRPCNGDVDEEKLNVLIKHVKTRMEACTGGEVKLRSGSTDANIPLSMGIPAVCAGLRTGGGVHTREEWVDIPSLRIGAYLAADLMLDYFE